MAEGVGFEPTAQGFAPRTAFPVPHLRPLGHPSWIAPKELAEGRGFEPPRDLLGPYPISSRTPSTGLGHPSAPVSSAVYRVSHCSRRMPPTAESQSCRSSTALTVLGATMAGAGAIFSTASTSVPGDRCGYH